MNYLDAFLSEVSGHSSKNTYSELLTKLTKPPFVSFVSASTHTFPNLETTPNAGLDTCTTLRVENKKIRSDAKPDRIIATQAMRHDHVNDPRGFPDFESLPGTEDLDRARTANQR